MASAFGFSDIDFESAEFSQKFYVQSRDKRFAYDLLHPNMLEFLLAASPPGVHIERGYLCISDGRSTWGPAVFTSLLPWVTHFLELWPEHLSAKLQENREAS